MRRLVVVSIIALALFGMLLFAGSSLSPTHAIGKPVPLTSFLTPNNQNIVQPQPYGLGMPDQPQAEDAEDAEEAEDPDMPKGKPGGLNGLDKRTYLRLRDEYIARKRGLEPGGPFDPDARVRAIRKMEVQQALRDEVARRLQPGGGNPMNLTAFIPTWTAIGPAPLPNGSGNAAVTGRVTAVVVDPTNSNKVYLATAQGGVWRSLDGGANWVNIFDNALSQAVGSLALAPSNPTILYVGTGESNRSGDSFFGVGIYRIDHVDTTATLVGPINPNFSFNTGSGTVTTRVFSGRSISQIVVHPTQPGTIFVGTSSGIGGSGGNSFNGTVPPLALLGLYRSTNADGPLNAITFQKLAVATNGASVDVPGTGNRRITDLVMEPGNPDNLIVGVFGAAATNDGGIFRTTNATAPNPTFTQVLTLVVDRIQFAINRNSSTGVVKVLAATGEQPSSSSCSVGTQLGVLHQSVDGGATWPATDATANTGGILTDAGGFCGAQCFYNVTVAIDPRNANSIFLGGNVQSTCSGLMQHSTNGVTFTHDATGLHADSHALYFDPLTSPSTIFAGNDGGIWKRSADAVGSFWTNLNSAPLNTMQFESVAVHPVDRYLTIGGTQDNGTEAQQSATGNWFNAEGGDGGYVLIDQGATDNTNVTMYHTFFNRTGTQIGFDRITNLPNCLPFKDSWPTRGDFAAADRPGPACDGTADLLNNGISRSDAVLFYAPMALGPGTPNTVYFGTDRLYRSTDRGDHMTIVSAAPVSATGSPISSIAISRQDDNYRAVGLQNGQVSGTSTGSSALVSLTSFFSFPTNPASVTNNFIGRAQFDPNNKDTLYVTLSYFAPEGQGIWKVTNFGDAAGNAAVTPNWTSAANGIPSVPINALVIDPINSNHLYAGTDIGVYDSTDAGASWNPYGVGLPRSAVFDLAIQSPNRILRAATHGRGIWEVSIPAAPVANTLQFSTTQLNVSETLNATTKVDITVTRAGDPSGAATIDYATADGTASERSDYLAARGTLNFDPGQTSKIITVFIVDDRLGESDENFTVTLSNPVGCTLGSPAATTVVISSNESVNGLNPVKWDAGFDTDFFVRQHYIDFFTREPDPSGLAFWKNQIDECTTPECREIRRINVSAAFFLSIEFQQTGYLVERLYKAAYGSASGNSTLGGPHQIAVPIVRFNEFIADTQQIGRGVVIGQAGAEQVLENNKRVLIDEFVLRPRFLADYPTSMTAATFVDQLNTRSGGVLSQTERDQLVSDLRFGARTRGQVLRAVAEDADLFNAESNRAFVLAQYFGYLRRNPNDPPENGLDYTGFDFWLSKLNQFNGNFVNAEMVKSFLVSGEYQQRFGP
ncbi:MAG TPA: Calx-beta domain-containing protein [Pyrinomonadaceae bacterium]|nr:Calx-beta domain-containing protein [Pyrinomonadaceae bacterium]